MSRIKGAVSEGGTVPSSFLERSIDSPESERLAGFFANTCGAFSPKDAEFSEEGITF